MGLRKILTDKEPALHKTCKEVENFDKKLHKLLDDMAETLEASEKLCDTKIMLLSLLGQIALVNQNDCSKEIQQFLSDALFQISCTYEAGQLAELIQSSKSLLTI